MAKINTVSFNPIIQVSQTPFNPALIILADASTGDNTGIASRRIYFTDNNGQPVVPSGDNNTWVDWAYANATITVNLLPTDMALNVRVDFLDSGNNVLYTTNINYAFTQYGKNFFYYLTQMQSETYNIVQDTNYFNNYTLLWINIIGAYNAVKEGNDLSGSQVCINRYTNLINNQQYNF